MCMTCALCMCAKVHQLCMSGKATLMATCRAPGNRHSTPARERGRGMGDCNLLELVEAVGLKGVLNWRYVLDPVEVHRNRVGVYEKAREDHEGQYDGRCCNQRYAAMTQAVLSDK